MRTTIPAFLVRPLVLTITFLLSAAGASAQLVNDGTTKIINGTSTNIPGFLSIGSTGPNTTLIVTNAGSVSADNVGIGEATTSTKNLVAVFGANSQITTPGPVSVFRIGDGSAYNQLFISAGGAVTTGYGVIGFPAGATNNTVLVTGSGSAWTNNVLYVGEGGSGNSLTVDSGGQVVANDSSIGVVSSASDNRVSVSGSNSMWTTAGTLNVGDAGSGSRLYVNNRGTVTADGITLGNQATSGGNLLSVAATVNVTNVAGNATLDVRRGNVELNGGTTTADGLLLTSPSGSFTFNEGTLVTRSAIISNGLNFAVGANAGTGPAGATFNNPVLTTIPTVGTASPYPSVINVAGVAGEITKVTVTLSNLSHTFRGDLQVMLAAPGAQRMMLMCFVGGSPSGVTNVTLTFDDAAAAAIPVGGLLTNGTYRPTGFNLPSALAQPAPPGPYSTNLSDCNGSSANGAWSLYIVDAAAGDSGSLGGWSLNIVTTNTGATWDVRSSATPTSVKNNLFIGENASNSRLLITNGAVLAGDHGYLGNATGASNNLAWLTGAGSLWTNGGSLNIGFASSGNQLVVGNGAVVGNPNGFLGFGASANNNIATVTGAGSRWRNNNLRVGESGSGNQLVVSGGGAVTSGDGDIGYQVGASNNVAIVTGAGSLWTNTSDLVVGHLGSWNHLVVEAGGKVSTPMAYVGNIPPSSNNLITVDGGTLSVAKTDGSGALGIRRGTNVLNAGLIETDNLLLTNSDGFFEFNGGTLITRNATINNGQNFVIGDGAGNGPAGAKFANGISTTIIDLNTASPYPSVINVANTVGSISHLTVTLSNLSHGYPRDMDVLLVGPSGQKVMLMSDVGGGGPGVNNVTLTFDDSAGAVDPNLLVASGDYRPTDGPAFDDPFPAPVLPVPYSTSLGDFNGSSANGDWSLFIVDDEAGGSGTLGGWSLNIVTTTTVATWDVRSNATPTTVANGLILGNRATSSTLLITNGGTLAVAGVGFGETASSMNNLMVVSGPNSLLNNSGGFGFGDGGSGNQMIVSNGGRVVAYDQVFLGNVSDSNSVVVMGVGSTWDINSTVRIGNASSGNQLTVSDGGVVNDQGASMSGIGGWGTNTAVVTGAGSRWNHSGSLSVGNFGKGNQMIISAGGVVTNIQGAVGFANGADNNSVLVTDPGSLWASSDPFFYVARQGSGNQLVVSNGGVVTSVNAFFGATVDAHDNVAIVTGAGSLWTNSGFLYVGQNGSGSQLAVSNGGTLSASNVYVGLNSGGNNRVTLNGGSLLTPNGVLDIRRGTNVLNAGLIVADQLVMTLGSGFFEFNGGTVNANSATVANGTLFTVGNGSSAATYRMTGTNTHAFSSGLRIASNGVLTGNGNVNSVLTVASGGTLSPGASIGRIVLFFAPSLQGNVAMEISKNGATLASDRVDCSVAFAYGGSLTVTKLGPTALAAGDSFQLFSAPGYSGTFGSITLPALGAGLSWTNRLLMDGFIAVVNNSALSLGAVTRNGTNLIYNVTGGAPGGTWSQLTTTNLALPLSSWTTNRSGVFNLQGNVALTNGISSQESKRYFRIKSP